MDVPENDRVDVDRHGVLGQGLLGIERSGLDALVDDGRHIVDDREDQEETRPFNTLELAGPQDDELLPGVGHFERERDDDGGHNKGCGKEEVHNLANSDTGKTTYDHQGQSNWVHATRSSRASWRITIARGEPAIVGSETTQTTPARARLCGYWPRCLLTSWQECCER